MNVSISSRSKQASAAALGILLAWLPACNPTSQRAQELTMAISPDLPPYILNGASSGLEVDLLREALPNHTLNFVQMPYAELQTAVPGKHAEISVGVQHFSDDGAFYSDDFITFENAAIAKKSADLKIAGIADLAGRKVLAWEDAYLELGPEFKALFSPDGPQRNNYAEVGDQREQVRMFWDAADTILVIDRVIFNYFSRESGHSPSDAAFHAIFPPVTNFKVAFRDEAVRDAFNQGLARLCQSGDYAKVLERYQVDLPHTICDR